ncbi:MAG: thiamine phosphate synthase [Candidatus Eisenbacteria bacterium]
MRNVGRLHVVTDAALPGSPGHREIARMAIAGGADVVQFREKRVITTRELIEEVRALLRLACRACVKTIVNDRVDVALAGDAQGVHVGSDDFPVSVARRLLGPDRIIGASARSVEEAQEAAWAGADYLGVGDVFGTSSKPDAGPVLGIEGLRRIVAAVEIPVIAIGGIGAEHVEPILAAGAHGIAVLSAVALADDPEAVTRDLRARMEQVLAARLLSW